MSAESRGRRALACPGFAWMPGMRDLVDGDRLIRCGGPRGVRVDDVTPTPRWMWAGGGWAEMNEGHEWIPDLGDPATIGCFAEVLVPVALRDPYAFLRWDGTHWEVVALGPGDDGLSVFGRGATKAEALVLALEAAAR